MHSPSNLSQTSLVVPVESQVQTVRNFLKLSYRTRTIISRILNIMLLICIFLLTLTEVTKESCLTGITFTSVVNRKHHHHSWGNSNIQVLCQNTPGAATDFTGNFIKMFPHLHNGTLSSCRGHSSCTMEGTVKFFGNFSYWNSN